MTPLTERAAWRTLAALAARPQPHLRERLHEPGRGDYARLDAAGIELDFTRQRIDRTIRDALLALAGGPAGMPGAGGGSGRA
ncbi:hypothetical protein [Cupriavidus sp. DF5525]|uniref:hypothetical protein n=1 Tax=Cupriavidus sp. DF5525 TaxID=3160989 RepID=UPI0003B008CA|nr:hypothetical protein N234_01450 [Ralstonia pickettii DTP0602]